MKKINFHLARVIKRLVSLTVYKGYGIFFIRHSAFTEIIFLKKNLKYQKKLLF